MGTNFCLASHIEETMLLGALHSAYKVLGAGKKPPQWLRGNAGYSCRDLNSIPSAHIRRQKTACNYNFLRSDTLFRPFAGTQHVSYAAEICRNINKNTGIFLIKE